MAVRQVAPHDHFPSGDSCALVELRFSPEELAARYGLAFEERVDDLDCLDLAAVALDDGSQVWLLRYRGEQDSGTTAYVDAGADLPRTKALLLQSFGLGEDDIVWVSPLLTSAALA